ncbi:MAG: ABC transporter permease [Tepidiformaceae bacterium]
MAEIVRQPALMFTLIVGPFLILLAFGQGVDIGGPRPRTIVVRPVDAQGEIQPLPEELNAHIEVVGETSDLAQARRELEKGHADVVAVLPPDPIAVIRRGEHIPIQILTNEIDPVTKSYAKAYLGDQVAELNQRTIAKAIAEAQASVADVLKVLNEARPVLNSLRANQGNLQSARTQVSDVKRILEPLGAAATAADTAARSVKFVIPGFGNAAEQTKRLDQLVKDLNVTVTKLDNQLNGTSGGFSLSDLDDINSTLTTIEQTAKDIQTIPPEVLSAPFQLRLENVAPFVPTFTGFYAPAVLALLLQHLAITLGALSMARIRLIGLMDLLRTSPVRPSEVVIGNYLSYGTLCAVAGAVLVALTVVLLDVPVFGSYALVAVALGLLIATALGVGFFISMISSSEQQAAQISMLILLGSIFFSGFVFSIDRIAWPIRAVSYALPSTYAIRTMQDVMLRGTLRKPEDLYILAGTALFFFLVTILLFKREFRPE